MRILSRNFCPVILGLIALLPLNGFAQNLTGIWRGWFVTEGGEQYKYELQIEQTKTNRISGVSYSYLDTRFYGKATLTGNYVKKNLSALVQEIKTVEVKMSGGSVACIMKCLFTYSKSGKEEFLEGDFTSSYEKADPLFGIKRGGNCGGGKVYLRKVITSDFYVEPFLRNKPQFKNSKPKITTTQTKPQNKPTVTSKTPVTKPPAPKNQTPKTQVTIQQKQDTIRRNTTPVVIDKPKEVPVINIPATTRSRENELVKTLTVTNESISVRLYDNGEIDGDTISVYLDGRPIISNKGLSTQPITVNLKMDEDNPDHVLVMVAENLGRIPPNTSLMVVQDGDKRYTVSITSTEQKNAMVRFRYQKK
ncbi:MAG TPA: hypothetical protein VNT20_01365 [Flavisolibacter sp.]|jgi:hypothetical protein|nr:hypothetical protein [Flavisolibacter sp.]